jgi:shikimate dehydrogenase
MIQLGLIGYPLGHSLSPRIHGAALNACGLPGAYSLFPIDPDDKQGLKDLLDRLRSEEITGLNVTIPHKQNVIPFLDELTPTAQTSGAVNTVYLQDNRLIGDNTDASGFLRDLKRILTTETQRHGEDRALVLGAGGSARAVVYALLNDGWDVTITARRVEQAEQIAARFEGVSVQEWNIPTFQQSNLQLIVNTTPVGMTPHIDHSPWPETIPFPTRAVIYDLVYNPRQTRLVQDACAQSVPATTGLGMLVEQAALSFEIWTGCHPPRETLFESVNSTVY